MINSFFLPNEVTTATISLYKEKVFYYISFEFILTAVLCFPSLFLIKSKPKSPPSLSQKHLISITEEKSLFKNIKILFANKNYLMFLFAASLMTSYGIMMATISNEWLASYKIFNPYTNISGFTTTLVAVISASFLSKFVDKNKAYKSLFIKLTLFGLLVEIALALISEANIKIFDDNIFYFWTFLSSLIMITILPFYTIGLDYACEITYPVGELLASGMIIFFAQIFSIFLSLLAVFLLNNLKKRVLIHVMIICMQTLSLIVICFYKEKLVRNNIDSQKNTNQYSDNTLINNNEVNVV